MGWQGLDTLG